MDLPSFIWLWRIAAWSMGLSLTTYCLLAASGGFLYYARSHNPAPTQATTQPITQSGEAVAQGSPMRCQTHLGSLVQP